MGIKLDALSLWYGDEEATRIDGKGVLKNPDDEAVLQIRLPRTVVSRADLPLDLEDWTLVATDDDGEHHHGEVVDCTHTTGRIELSIPDGTPVIYP